MSIRSTATRYKSIYYLTNYLIGFCSELLKAGACAERLDEVGNGPLNTIGRFAHLLGDHDSTKSDAGSAEHIAKIQSELQSLSSLVKSLLSYARIGGGDVHRIACNCEHALESVRQKLKWELERDRADINQRSTSNVSC